MLKEQIEINKFQSDIAPDLLAPFKWISNINSLSQMKEFVSKTSDEVGFNCYWADEVAISLLETVLNIKFIIVRDNDSIKGAKPTSNFHNNNNMYSSRKSYIPPQIAYISEHQGLVMI
mgnify:CR=1 FL=1